ncbi:hypothetical protein [Anaerotruncus rubiinfantis]|uniref:hypothetical protein n=1 Tax=Anaerotruncus rubiinfantis TaxID=1720200 RepID=UPI00083380EF|nr:hypothetical protein [Anaerotruncus rubiinfantis]
MIELNGITWDHKRGFDPLIHVTKEFESLHPDIKITWKKRSLRDFGDYPVEKLAADYDLLLIDHPFTGEACRKQLYVDLETCISPEHFELVRKQEIGRSFSSYCYDGKQLAFPVDVAALVSASRDDLLEKLGIERPQNLSEVFRLRERLPSGMEILAPLCPTDIWCLFLSLCAADAGDAFLREQDGIDPAVGGRQIENIRALAKICGGNPFAMNPVHVLDEMSCREDAVYCPFLFGYVNYSIPGNYPNIVRFYNSPLWESARYAPILGGVGIAISSQCTHTGSAARFVEYVTLPEVQKGIYFSGGGQPGQRDAWLSSEINQASNGFFQNTIETIEHAYLRPRVPNWNRFQETGSVALCDGISKNMKTDTILQKLNELYHEYLKTGERLLSASI